MCINDIGTVVCPVCHETLFAKPFLQRCRLAFNMGMALGECGSAWEEKLSAPVEHEWKCELCQYQADEGIPANTSDMRRQKRRAAEMMRKARLHPLTTRMSQQSHCPANRAGFVLTVGEDGEWRQEHVGDEALAAAAAAARDRRAAWSGSARSDQGDAGDQEDHHADEDTEFSEGDSFSDRSLSMDEENFMYHSGPDFEDDEDSVIYSDTETLVDNPDDEDRPALKDITNIILYEQHSDDEFEAY